MSLIRIIYFLFAFCGTISQGLWIGPLNAEVILIVDIPLLMMFIVGRNKLRKDPKSKKVLLAMQLYLLWTFVGLLFAFNKHDAFLDVITNVRAFLIMLAVYKFLNSKKDLEFFLLGIGFGLLFQGLVGVYQWRVGYANLRFLGEMNFGWQSSGTFVHPNIYGLYLLLLTPLVYRLAFFIETKWKNVFLIIFLVGVTALFAAQSRACWLGFTAAMCIFGFYDLVRRRLLKTKMMKFWVIIGFVGIIGIVQYGYIITGRFADAEESMTSKRSSSRLSLAKDAVRIIGENLVWGVGPDNYSYFASEETAGLRVVHCTYLLIAAELGIPGIIFFLLMFFQVGLYGLRALKSPDIIISNVAAGTMTSFVAFCIAILVSPDYRLVWVKNHAWLLFGLILALGKLAFNDERQRIKLKKIKRYRQVQALMAKRQREEEEAEARELNMPLKPKSKEKNDAS